VRLRPFLVESLEERQLLASASVSVAETLTAGAGPQYITTGPDGNLWFTEGSKGDIARLTPSGTLTEFPVPGSGLSGITTGPDGNLWAVEWFSDNIVRITPSGTVTEFPLSGGNAEVAIPMGIAAGPDGNLWFTEYGTNQIGKITPSGTITLYPLGVDDGPDGITLGPDGNLWFAEYDSGGIGRITPTGAITEFPSNDLIGGSLGGTEGITVGSDGNLWFTDPWNDQVGKITTSGSVSYYNLPNSNSWPAGIVSGPGGDLYFTEEFANQIGRITTGGTLVAEYPIPTPNSEPLGIAIGPDNHVWFAELEASQLGRLDLAPTANNDSYSATKNTPLIVPAPGVLANDTDPENDPLTAVLVSNPAHGSLTLNSDGSFTYTPHSGFHGTDSFTYEANDGILNSAPATVTITVNNQLPPQGPLDPAYSTNENTSLIVSGPGVLADFTDPSGLPLSAVLVTGPANGSLMLNADGSFTYTPNSGFFGSDSFTYEASDGNLTSAPATVTLTVNQVASGKQKRG
jgi:VCBS repeat-containing protein